MPSIEISEATYQRLVKHVRSFGDDAEAVIQRLLDESEPLPTAPKPRRRPPRRPDHRAASGSILPEGEYWRPILSIIEETGGSAPASDVIDALEQRLGDRLRPRDFDVLEMGEVRWRNRARFARLRMKEQGLVSSTSRRGVWEITSRGRDYLQDG